MTNETKPRTEVIRYYLTDDKGRKYPVNCTVYYKRSKPKPEDKKQEFQFGTDRD